MGEEVLLDLVGQRVYALRVGLRQRGVDGGAAPGEVVCLQARGVVARRQEADPIRSAMGPGLVLVLRNAVDQLRGRPAGEGRIAHRVAQ
jgi:hypothetical protein